MKAVNYRLDEQQVATYRQEGYLIYPEPIFNQQKFESLRRHFEQKLNNLDPETRPEAMDTPHYGDPALFEWLFADEVLDLVEPLLGPDIALYSSHFICKPKGNGKRVPWHTDANYWKKKISPVEVVTVWFAIDPSTQENGCMYVIPRTHHHKSFDYEDVDTQKNVFATEIIPSQREDSKAIPCELPENHASLHDGCLAHGSPPNSSNKRRCGYTMRYMSTRTKFNFAEFGRAHQIYLARGTDHAGNVYSDPSKAYPELMRYKERQANQSGH
jgi:hypothetical protein